MIKLCHYKILSVNLYPFGGITKIDKPINSSINKEILISISGILMQLILGLTIYLGQISNIFKGDYSLFYFYNKMIIIFNILPMYPLDGSKFIGSLLEKFFSYEKSLTYNNFLCGDIFILFVIYNIYTIRNYTICSFLIWQFVIIIKNQKYLKERFYLERYLYNFPYQKIENHKNICLNKLKKNTLHFFWFNNHYIHEKSLLRSYFDN